MNHQDDRNPYSAKDIIQALCGIPIVVGVAIFCANFATSYAGI